MNTTEHVITELEARQPDYHCNERIAAQLHGKNLLIFVAPASVGKSTLMNALENADEQFSRIGGVVSREARSDDEPGLYRYIPHTSEGLQAFLSKVKAGEVVQYVVHPTKKHVYATEIEDYAGQINMKDVIGQGVAGFRELPVVASYTCSLVCEPGQWRSRLLQRYRPDDPELQKRDSEARMNLMWSLQDKETVFIDNSDGNLESAVQRVQCYVQDPSRTQEQKRLRAMAKAMIGVLS